MQIRKGHYEALSLELSDEQKVLLDEQKILHREGKTISYSISQARKIALKQLKKK